MAIDTETVNSAVAWTFGGSGAMLGAAFAFRKMFSQWIGIGADAKAIEAGQKVMEAGANANVAGSMAVNTVYETLTKEIARLAEVNTSLSNEITKLHNEISTLRTENLDLRDEVNKLNDQLERFERLYSSCETCPANERKAARGIQSHPQPVRHPLDGE
jgi:FtsZ-binding cell division protein ZapB